MTRLTLLLLTLFICSSSFGQIKKVLKFHLLAGMTDMQIMFQILPVEFITTQIDYMV